MIRLLIADDHPVVREGLRRIIAEQPAMVAAGEATTGDDVLEKVRALAIDVLLLDISMPGRGFLDVLRQLREEQPRVRVLVLSMHPEEQYAVRALRAGAAGYLTKDHSPEQLVEAIGKVMRGGRFVSASLAEKLAHDVVATTPNRPPPRAALPTANTRCSACLGSGRSVKEVAAQLGLSPKTASTYRTRLLEKMRVSTNADLVRVRSTARPDPRSSGAVARRAPPRVPPRPPPSDDGTLQDPTGVTPSPADNLTVSGALDCVHGDRRPHRLTFDMRLGGHDGHKIIPAAAGESRRSYAHSECSHRADRSNDRAHGPDGLRKRIHRRDCAGYGRGWRWRRWWRGRWRRRPGGIGRGRRWHPVCEWPQRKHESSGGHHCGGQHRHLDVEWLAAAQRPVDRDAELREQRHAHGQWNVCGQIRRGRHVPVRLLGSRPRDDRHDRRALMELRLEIRTHKHGRQGPPCGACHTVASSHNDLVADGYVPRAN